MWDFCSARAEQLFKGCQGWNLIECCKRPGNNQSNWQLNPRNIKALKARCHAYNHKALRKFVWGLDQEENLDIITFSACMVLVILEVNDSGVRARKGKPEQIIPKCQKTAKGPCLDIQKNNENFCEFPEGLLYHSSKYQVNKLIMLVLQDLMHRNTGHWYHFYRSG